MNEHSCPKCGLPELVNPPNWSGKFGKMFACGSKLWDDGQFVGDVLCLQRQLAALDAENMALKAKISVIESVLRNVSNYWVGVLHDCIEKEDLNDDSVIGLNDMLNTYIPEFHWGEDD